MKVISYLATLPKKQEPTPEYLQKQNNKANTLRYFIDGVINAGDEGQVIEAMQYEPADVAMILGWVHENGKTGAHLAFRQEIIDRQKAIGGRTVIADSNLFLYKNTTNPGYWLRYSYDGVFPITGEYCDHEPDPIRWEIIKQAIGVELSPWRKNGDHILICLQRDGGWSMAGWNVVDWALNVITTLRKFTQRSIRIRAHPGDKRAKKYCDRLLKLCRGRSLLNVHFSTNERLEDDLSRCWAMVNHNSSPAVASALQGIPIFVTDPDRSQCKEIANINLANIENPIMYDRESWIKRISQFHWSHSELKSGHCWRHMKRWANK